MDDGIQNKDQDMTPAADDNAVERTAFKLCKKKKSATPDKEESVAMQPKKKREAKQKDKTTGDSVTVTPKWNVPKIQTGRRGQSALPA